MTNFLKYPEYLLLHWRLNTYLVLIMGSADAIDNWTRRAVDLVQQVCTAESSVGGVVCGGVAGGYPAQRAARLFRDAVRLWS